MKQISIRAFVLVLSLAGLGSMATANTAHAKARSASAVGSTIIPPCGPKTCQID